MRIRINGEQHELPDGATVRDALEQLGAPGAGIAVAVDNSVVPRAAWPETELTDDSVVEVLTAVQGG